MGSGDRRPGSHRVSRRAVLGGAAGAAVLLGLAGCGSNGKSGPAPTPTTEPTPTVTPVPTQAPLASPVPGYLDPQRWRGRTLTVASWGGDYQDAQDRAFFAAFAKATGADVQQKTADLTRLRKQVDSAAVSWDVVDVPTDQVLPLSRKNYLSAIDYKVVDRTALFTDLLMQYGVGIGYFSTVIVYRAGAEKVPSGWQDFWDVAALPGLRALDGRSPVGNLEFALLADGVRLSELYPLDVGRAFESLDRIRPHVAIWYQDGKQPAELVASEQIAMGSSWNVRADSPDVRSVVSLQWNGGMLAGDSWVIPRGAPNADVAMDFINYATRAVPSANFSRLFPFGPINKDAFPLIAPERVALLPNAESNRALQFVEGFNWWADNADTLSDRFEDWLLEKPKKGTPGA